MSDGPQLLPDEFADLERFAEDWAISGSDQRKTRRIESSDIERRAFYDAVWPELKRALAYLDGFHIDDLPPREARLMDLMLTFVHVSLAVENQQENEPIHAISHAMFTITRSTEDAR